MIIIYYTDKSAVACSERFEDIEFTQAMELMELLRRAGHSHVCMSCEFADSVGKPGVDSVHDGKTPDGELYTWSKQYRGAGPLKQ